MADIINEDGLELKTLNEIIEDLETGFKNIYGQDINVDSDTQDGQIINLLAQTLADLRSLANDVYQSFNPDTATGAVLDQRVVINNIERKAGTFTIAPVEITVDRTVTLDGLDVDFNNVDGTGYTVQDDAGTQFILVDTTVLTPGTTSLNFRAKEIGEVEVLTDTITNAVTVVLGVTGINNPSGSISTGENEETDTELRIRRSQSVANASNGYLNGLLGSVLDLDGVTEARLFENVTNVVDSDGIPAHGMWLIANGGANSDIANVIYEKKSYGANMKGGVVVPITTASGGTFNAKFDRPTGQDLFIRFDIKPTVTGQIFDQPAIKQYIVDNLEYSIGEFAETSAITAVALDAINANGGGGVPINVEISDDGSIWVDFLETPTLDTKWTITTTNITITEV
jgi:uncharacterized phage protein gp47/JayE